MRVSRFFNKLLSFLPKVTLHPLFLTYLAVLFFCGAEDSAAISLLVVVLHEVGHYAVAKLCGVKLGEVVLYPFGAVMVEESEPTRKNGWKIALAGIFVNFLCAILGFVALLFLKSSFIVQFVNANLTIGLFNLLPVYPLDGGCAIIYSSKKPVRTIKILRLLGVIASGVLFVLFLTSLVWGFNLSFGVLGLFLLIGAVTGVEKEMSSRVAKLLLAKNKDFDTGVPVSRLACGEDMAVHKVLSKISPSRITEIEIVCKNGDKKEVSEEEFLNFATLASSTAPIGKMLKNTV